MIRRHSGAQAKLANPESSNRASGFRVRRPPRPGMMVWTAPDGIIGAKLVVLIRNSKGDRP